MPRLPPPAVPEEVPPPRLVPLESWTAASASRPAPPAPSGRVQWQFQHKGKNGVVSWSNLDQKSVDAIEEAFKKYNEKGRPYEVEYTINSKHKYLINFKYMNSTPQGAAGGKKSKRTPVQRVPASTPSDVDAGLRRTSTQASRRPWLLI